MDLFVRIIKLITFSLVLFMTGCLNERLDASIPVWSDDFEDGNIDGWTIIDAAPGQQSNWYLEDGYLIQTSNIGAELLGTDAVAGDVSWTDYTMVTDLAVTDDDYIGVMVRYQDPDNYYRLLISSQSSIIRFDKRLNGTFENLYRLDMMWPKCRIEVAIDVRGSNMTIFLDKHKMFTVNDSSIPNGKIGFVSYYNTGAFFNEVAVYDSLEIVKEIPKLEITRGPYMQNVLGDSATVKWNTNLYKNSAVQFGTSKENTDLVFSQQVTGNHELVLHGLDAGQTYHYRVWSDTLVSEWYEFTAAKAPEEPYRFLLYGDSQLDFLKHAKLTARMAEEGADFISHVGDIVTYGPRPDWDTEFFGPLSELLTSIPIYVSIGNHNRESSYFGANFDFPDPVHENYFSFRYGNGFFVYLDNCIAAYPDRNHPDISVGSEQYKWLEGQLASEEAQLADWIFVYGHIPIYSEGTNYNYSLNRITLVSLFETYEVDFFSAGHVHGYERGYSNGTNYLVSGGGGGVMGSWKRDIPQIVKHRSKNHYCVFDVVGNAIAFKAVDIDGNVLDQLVFSKEPSAAEDDGTNLPDQLHLANYPNPFNASTNILYSLPQAGHHTLRIFDLEGRMVKELISGYAPMGENSLTWNGLDALGHPVPSGIYLCRIQSTVGSECIKLNYLK